MPILNQVISIEEAIQRVHPTWDVEIGGFGRLTADRVYPQIVTPIAPALPSVAAIAIGPRSQIDRCWVLWDPQVTINLIAPAMVGFDYFRRLTRQAPLIFAQFGNKQLVTPSGQTPISPNSAIRVVASLDDVSVGTGTRDDDTSLIVPANFTANGETAPRVFLMDANDPPGVDRNLSEPRLHLVFYLQPPAFGPPLERFPYQRDLNFPDLLTSPVGQYVFGGCIPTHGRRLVDLVAYTDNANDIVFDVRIGGLKFGENQADSEDPHEWTFDTTTLVSINAGDVKRLQIVNPGCDYLTYWARHVSGATTVGARLTCWTVD